ncbi:MAG: methionine--tRNA ligase [Lachnospiraceae bacterium]|nr:methionine--tRNA ligase [Lachnospiraceae bacterium]
MKNILIGGAWPYANGSLHIGHIAALLPGDILARYWRSKGENVFYVSGSDCHGTPITIRAKQEGISPEEICELHHAEFCEVFQKMGFSYDCYTKTSDEKHKEFVKTFHKKLYESPYVSEKTVKQAYCSKCEKILTDRMIVGACPVCKAPTRGDQCDACGEVLDVENIVGAKCAECGTAVEFGETTQLFLLISKLEKELKDFLADHPGWRKNAVAFTRRYIEEGLRDRAITRDLEWGIDVPKEGYENKKIYIWAENVLGYLSASKVVAEQRDIPIEEVWGENARHYYVHGKDNIPFHTIILPALLIGNGAGWRLPDDIISSEYLTLEGRKISTSQNWAIWAKDIVDRYNPDAIRYFFIANGPEKRDTDFSWHEFLERNNSELVGAYGNLVNRTLAFIAKYMKNEIPNGTLSEEIGSIIKKAYISVGEKIERGNFKDALDEIFEIVRYGNKYYDAEQPWITRNTDLEKCQNTLFNCTQLIANLSILLHPFLPFSSSKVEDWLCLVDCWEMQSVPSGLSLPHISILFERLDKKIIEEELKRLENS